MAAPAIFKIWKMTICLLWIASILPTVFAYKFYAFKNFGKSTIQDGGQLPSGKYKKHDISEIIWTYFSRILVCWCIIVLPGVSAIKCTVTDNKTAIINDKNCSLSIMLTVMDKNCKKIIKRWCYSASRWHHALIKHCKNHKKGDIAQHHVDI